MAILLTELYDAQCMTEATEAGKKYFIEGVFMQSDVGNRNGRIYPKPIMEREVNKYNESHIKQCRAMGELNHPANRVTVDPREASHLITELRMDGADVYGKAKVIDTPTGKIVKTLMDEGIKFGVSSRALGSVVKRQDGLNEVQNDFDLRTVDIVSDPSAPSAWVTSLFENKEWVCNNGVWSEQQIEESKTIIRKASLKTINETTLKQFEKFINSF